MNGQETGATRFTTQEDSIFDTVRPLPVYYSKRIIYTFSILFGVLFGSVLMAINFNHTA